MKLNLFAIGATALCFFQQVTATSAGQTDARNDVQINDHSVSKSDVSFIPSKRDGILGDGDGLLGGVGKLLHELLGEVGLGELDLSGLKLDDLGKDLEHILKGLLGKDGDYSGLIRDVKVVYCEKGIDLDDDDDNIDDEITKRAVIKRGVIKRGVIKR